MATHADGYWQAIKSLFAFELCFRTLVPHDLQMLETLICSCSVSPRKSRPGKCCASYKSCFEKGFHINVQMPQLLAIASKKQTNKQTKRSSFAEIVL